ncbi:hypothetical protein D7X48_10595 [bacterium D16-50]|jgi:flagellar protein FlgJ|nr:hypothetical protein [Lachnospiraceae bacterium]RKJ20005.1 hypothetical protein D7X48_10595 [bacterium D16-50]
MIDYSDVASMYGSTYANAANQTANKLQNTLDGVKGTASKDELMDACRQFEAYFVEQMFKSMMKTVPSEGNTSNYTSTMMDYYKDQMVQSMAEESTAQGGFGLAQMLYEQMKRNYGVSEIPEGVE